MEHSSNACERRQHVIRLARFQPSTGTFLTLRRFKRFSTKAHLPSVATRNPSVCRGAAVQGGRGLEDTG
jgi:hypothetical protein